jgi:cell division protein FtsL
MPSNGPHTKEVLMQEREAVRNEIPLHIVDRLESEWRSVQVERSSLGRARKTDTVDRAAAIPVDNLGTANS